MMSGSSQRKDAIAWGTMFSLKNGSKEEEFRDNEPRKEDRWIRILVLVLIIMIRDVINYILFNCNLNV